MPGACLRHQLSGTSSFSGTHCSADCCSANCCCTRILIRFSSMIRSRQATIRLRVSPLPDTPCCFQMFRGSSAARAPDCGQAAERRPGGPSWAHCHRPTASSAAGAPSGARIPLVDLAGALSSSFLRGSFLLSDGLSVSDGRRSL